MFGQTPEISETLQWMLQSRQVGDDTLVKTLVHEQYAHIRRFVSTVIKSQDSDRCEWIADQVISAAVEDTASYQGKMNVQAWLFKKSITVIRQLGGSLGITSKITDHRISSTGNENISQRMMDWQTRLSSEMCITITLFYLFEFKPSQIAAVIDLPEDRVSALLKEAIKRCLASARDSGYLDAAEVDFQRILNECWPPVVMDERSEVQVSQRILNRLQAKDKRKRRMVYFGEAFLAILGIFFVAGLGSLISRFTPEPTREIVYETRMVNQIIFVSPTPGPTQPPRPFPEKAIIYEAVGGETLDDVAEKIYFNAQILGALNNFPVDQLLEQGQKIMIGISESMVIMPTLNVPDSTPQAPIPTPDALSQNSDVSEIKHRIMSANENWRTLWADALVIQYGPHGCIGEPDYRRQQIWIDQPYFHYLLDGENGGEVEFAYSVVGGWENLLNIRTGDLLSNVGPQELNYRPELRETIFNRDFKNEFAGEIEIVRQDAVAGRDVLVLDWYAEIESLRGTGYEDQQQKVLQGRYWVDLHLGSILRVQKFSGNSPDQLFREMIISKILFDVPIPRRLYDRSQYLQTYFAKDNTGDYVHEPIAIPEEVTVPRQVLGSNQYQPPPAGFYINNSQLDFHWTSLRRFCPEQGTRVDLFADGYFLGNVDFGEPEQMICARSPDGGLIAFSSWSSELDIGFTPLGWLNLNHVPEVHSFNSGLIPYDFAFSNDSQQLAVYACQRDGEQACGLYIVETGSGETRLLRAVEQGSGIIWSPDDKAIAIQGSFLKGGKWRLLVLSTKSGNVIYDGPFDWEGFWVAHDSPVHDWGVQYPPLRGGLELCTLPPAQ